MEQQIRELLTKEELLAALPVLQELRTHLHEKQFFELYEVMKHQGYRLFALCKEDGEICSLAGVAICTNLYNLKHVFIYELVTSSKHRSKGYGKQLLFYIETWGKENGCTCVNLTSGLQRIDAHRFYEREEYKKVSYSFRKSF